LEDVIHNLGTKSGSLRIKGERDNLDLSSEQNIFDLAKNKDLLVEIVIFDQDLLANHFCNDVVEAGSPQIIERYKGTEGCVFQ
jgi:hypothetical protein